ncbi:alpha-dioxygenase 1-like [Andrographis paniculata]|uniref:alpha-dioxygenase 1-like n=1 Tax=Andrographis paniculata TaxID=175694 RepID=UPI0021E92421|nr:alpha-dioxygenase 1-like [Andrographis paniculata]
MSSSLNYIFLVKPFKFFILHDFHDLLPKMPLLDRFTFLIVHLIDRVGLWHRLPVFLGLIYLVLRQSLHRRYNLLNVGDKPPLRDGAAGDGGAGAFFGRNLMPVSQKTTLTRPDPMVVASKLLSRRKFIDTGKQFNLIAASWIQFMVHDWIDHLEDTDHPQIELKAPEEVASQCPVKSFNFYKSKEIQINTHGDDDAISSGFLNRRTPWWDGSAIYGNDTTTMQRVRTFKDGKLKLSGDGLIPLDQNGIPISGDVRNIWAGLSALHSLFVQEHNAVCDALKKEYPDLKDEQLYRHARRVTAAVIAKIHTIDWTVELLKTDMLRAGMRANWYGLLGKTIKDRFGHLGSFFLSGYVGIGQTNDHGVPYSLTEEFVTVYRLHSLLPDTFQLRNTDAAPGPNKSLAMAKEIGMEEMIGREGTDNLSRIGLTKQIVSMGHQSCGALELWNYPVWLRRLIPQNTDGSDRPAPVDLAALEVYRDRERSVARYNEFRRSLMLIPIRKWEDLTDDAEAVETLRQVYGEEVEELDALVGMMAEKKIKGFAISETAFIIFLLMAPRRLESDPYFTGEFNEATYTKKGLEWVNTTESLKDVLDRHFPEMAAKWMNSGSAFSVWDAPPEPYNPVPLYLRLPK